MSKMQKMEPMACSRHGDELYCSLLAVALLNLGGPALARPRKKP